MSTKMYIHEVFDEIEKIPSMKERKESLQRHAKTRPVIPALLRLAYDKRVEVLLPETDPPFKKSDLMEGLTDTRLDNEVRRFKVFIRGQGYDNLRQPKREGLFLSILESLHSREAEIMVQCFQHKFRLKGFTIPEINDVFNWSIPYRSRKADNGDTTDDE